MSAPNISCRVVLVTPEVAERWLATRSEEQKRRFRRSVAMKYAAAMKALRWSIHGDSIDFDSDGRLSNGQHRLVAIIESGLPQTFVVVEGVAPKAFAKRDRSYGRTPGQILKMDGFTNGDALANAAAILWLEETGRLGGGWTERPDADLILEIVERNPGLEEAVSRANMTATALYMSRGLAGWAYFKFSRIDETLAEEFFQNLKTGVGLSEGDPALVLRNRLLSMRASRSRLQVRDVAVLLVRAWNHCFAGRKVRTLKASVRINGERIGQFPLIAGEVDS